MMVILESYYIIMWVKSRRHPPLPVSRNKEFTARQMARDAAAAAAHQILYSSAAGRTPSTLPSTLTFEIDVENGFDEVAAWCSSLLSLVLGYG